ncbi:MAG: transcriptional regulator NrdR [Pseudomonadota bacterium]
MCNEPETKVIDSRLLLEGSAIRRRRKCEKCGKRFTTYEEQQIQMPSIVKNDGRRENFNREKILMGIRKACHKRPISTDQILEFVEGMEKGLLEHHEKEVSTTALGEMIMDYLFNIDPVAYVRFASFYWNFQDVDDFVKSLQEHVKSPGLKERDHVSK